MYETGMTHDPAISLYITILLSHIPKDAHPTTEIVDHHAHYCSAPGYLENRDSLAVSQQMSGE